jgi:D-alanyl-D-alanine carboxypeptidase (penicillin-binding protein 5/6)
MFTKIRFLLIPTFALLLICHHIPTAAALETMSKDPYAGAIVVDVATGSVLFADTPDAKAYPASVTKLMVMLIILEAVETHHLTLDEPVTVTAASAKIGGSQVYLKENEVFPVEELLYALVVESANDAATALAIHYAGSKKDFVTLMNARAKALGMNNTDFHSVQGLPPEKGQLPDVSTPRDIAKLCRELLKNPKVLKYTSTKVRPFRLDADEPFIMRNHNKLLRRMEECDGLKTGYFRKAGYSIAATAARNDQRVVAVVLGAKHAKIRDAKAKEMLSEGLSQLMKKTHPIK